MKITITPENFRELLVKGYSLDVIYILKLIEAKLDVVTLCESSAKIKAIHLTLLRKELITEDNNLTLIGQDLLKFIDSKESTKIVKRKISDTDFNRWWKTFPGTDTFTYEGRKFTGSRSLRVNKEACRSKFNKILIEGEYTSQQLIDSLSFDVQQKVVYSVKTGQNKLSYLQNSLTYLNQRSYEPFIELINKGVEVEGLPSTGGTDI